MLSAVLTLAFYGFLRCGEFTVPSGAAYSPLRHLSMQDVVFYLGALYQDTVGEIT